MVRYLVEHGADVRIAKEHNVTNVMVSARYAHQEMIAYLVDELGCDVNECDDDGRSALFDAVNSGSLETVQFLLERGARNFRATFDHMSPLMWAAEKRRADLVDVLSHHCSLLELIEAKELLASAFVCREHGTCDLERSFEQISRAIELRSIHSFPKVVLSATAEVFENRQECQTIDQLEELRSNPIGIHVEVLLVRERLLGPANSEYLHSLRYHGAWLADNGQHNRAVAFWMYELALRRQYSIPIDTEYLRIFASLFAEIVFQSLPIPTHALLQVMTATSDELACHTTENDYNMHALLFLVTVASQLLYY
ncbi:unnamed protein product [Didymodactylos carnosus]|uniref:Uncharacterized protein n=1 Tax=Didymodactylos carnosus TaxID=1234261 RepID=A0A8S2FB11_9BILA|nr:unnamed protein product [Didymodactylos carnosus]CAF4211398.1 unnamed protein product [Didymodactylos carnosus]